MMSVDQIQQVRQLKYVNCLSIREIVKRTGISRNTVRKILRSEKTKFEYVRETQSISNTIMDINPDLPI